MPDDLPAEAAGERDWHWRDAAPDEVPLLPEAKRRTKLVLALVFGAALIGTVFALVTWYVNLPGLAVIQSLIVWEQEDPVIPARVVALDDSDLILRNFPEQRQNARQSQALENLKAELRKIAQEKKGPIVVHVSCPARTYEGEVYLLPARANPDDVDSWLKLDFVLDALQDCGAKNKLLLLDLAHPLADTRLGLVCDDVAGGVEKTLKRRPSANFFVLNSCSPGQTTTTLHLPRRSAFAHFVDQGLRGAADGWGEKGVATKVITVKELAAYVRRQTEDWAEKNRGVKQTPWLWGEGTDFTLVDRNVKDPPPEIKEEEKKEPKQEEEEDPKKKKEPPPPSALPAPLKLAWELRDKLAAYDGRWMPPASLLTLDLQLLHIELHWRGGHKKDARVSHRGEAELNELIAAMQKLQARIDAALARPPFDPPPSIAIAYLGRPEPDKAVVKAMVEVLKNVTAEPLKADPKERAEQDKKEAKDLAAVPEELLKPVAEQKEALPKVVALLEAANSLGNLNRLQATLVADVTDKLLPRSEYVETLWLKRAREFDKFIRDRDDPTIWRWPANEVSLSLKALRASEALLALLAQEPELLRWLDERYDKIEDMRREGERLLFWGKPLTTWKKAAASLTQAAQDYEALTEALSEVRAARRAHEQALHRLPGYYQWFDARAEWTPEEKDAWDEARDWTRDISKLLAEKPTRQTTRQLTGAPLFRSLEALASKQRSEVEKYTRLGKDQGPGALAQIQALRASTALSAEQRGKLWRTAYEIAEELHANFQPDTRGMRQATVAILPRSDDQWKAQLNAGRTRANLALDILTLAGVKEADNARADLEAAENKAPMQAWEKLGGSLRIAWLRLRNPVGKAEPSAMAESFKLLMPVTGGDAQFDAVDVEQQATLPPAFRAWVGERFRNEAKFLQTFDTEESTVKGNSVFFFKVADRMKQR